MSRCARCDFRTDPDGEGSEREQLTAHAEGSAHPLCTVCSRSLEEFEPAVCGKCLTTAHTHLSGITTMYLQLGEHLGHLNGSLKPQEGRSSDGRPLLGGTVLVLMTNGSEGVSDDGETSREKDPPSIPYELGWWAEEIMRARRDFVKLGASPARRVERASTYLSAHLGWAANNHAWFPKLANDLRGLHGTLEHHTARDVPRERANADCFDCGGELVRIYRETIVEGQGAQQGQSWVGHLPDEHWTCRVCGEEYDDERYNLALSEAYSANRGWVGQAEAARLLDMWPATVRQWATRGLVKTRRQGGRREVWWPDVKERAKGSAA